MLLKILDTMLSWFMILIMVAGALVILSIPYALYAENGQLGFLSIYGIYIAALIIAVRLER